MYDDRIEKKKNVAKEKAMVNDDLSCWAISHMIVFCNLQNCTKGSITDICISRDVKRAVPG